MDCKHAHFDVTSRAVQNAANTKFRVDLQVKCADCSEAFRFLRAYVSNTNGGELTAEIVPGLRKVNRQLPAKDLKAMNEWQL